MRSSLLAVFAASAVSAASVPALAPALPLSAFPKFEPIPLADALQGIGNLVEGLDFNLTNLITGQKPNFDNNLAIPTVQTASAASCSSNPGVRFEWRQYSESDRLAFMSAINCLRKKAPSGNFQYSTTRYEDFVRLHQMFAPNIHENAKFLVWHRYYLWTFEQVLRSECGFNRAWPWWDETKDAGKFAQSDMFTNPNYFGHLPAKPANGGTPPCITSGAFAGMRCNLGPGSSVTTPHCLMRAVDETATAQSSSAYIAHCNTMGSFAEYSHCLELGPHGYGHNGIGAVMADVQASVSDPIFWMHHGFIDRAFRVWQNADGARVSSINGNDAQGNAMTLDTMLDVGAMGPKVRVRDVLNTLGGTTIGGKQFCYKYTY